MAKEQIIKVIDYSAVYIADMTFASALIVLGFLLWNKPEWRYPLISCGCLYLTVALLWHYIP